MPDTDKNIHATTSNRNNMTGQQPKNNPDQKDTASNPNMIFTKTNILMMLGCLALIIIGFLLMSGGSSSVEGGFNPDIFSTRRIVVGPTLAFLGFFLMAFAIIMPSKRKKRS